MEHTLRDAPDKLAVAIWEADRHVSALRDALAVWHVNPPATLEQVESNLSPAAWPTNCCFAS